MNTTAIPYRLASHSQLVLIADYRNRLINAGHRDEVIEIYEHVFGLNASRATDHKISDTAAAELLRHLKRSCVAVAA